MTVDNSLDKITISKKITQLCDERVVITRDHVVNPKAGHRLCAKGIHQLFLTLLTIPSPLSSQRQQVSGVWLSQSLAL